MNRNNIKILNKLNKLIDEEIKNNLMQKDIIRGCLAYIVSNNLSMYCPFVNASFTDDIEYNEPELAEKYESYPYYKTLPDGTKVFEYFGLDKFDIIQNNFGNDSYFYLSTYPFLKKTVDGDIQGYTEIPLIEALKYIEFENTKQSGIAIETENNIYYIETETVLEILDKTSDLTDSFVRREMPRMGVWTGSILDPKMNENSIMKISTDRDFADENTFVIDIDDDIENIKCDLINLLDKSKENDGPDSVCIQVACPIDYDDMIISLVKFVHWYLTEKDKYYLLINFITEEPYYLGFINALIKSYYDGFDILDFEDDILNGNDTTVNTQLTLC